MISICTEFGYILDTTFSNLEKKLTLIPFSLSENDKLSQKTVKSKELVAETQSLLNEDTEISIVIDRLIIDSLIGNRLADGVETALNLSPIST